MANKQLFFFNIKLIDVRLWFHIIAFLHLFVTAIVTLSIDTTVDEDVRVKAYIHLRWKLLTTWYNLITLVVYLPLCVYCGFKEKRGQGYKHHVQQLRYLTDVLMTSILFPTTMYGDIAFWVMMNTDASLIAPPKLFDYVPCWCQHSLHSVSMGVVIVDLVLTPRTRPTSLMPRYLLGIGFSTVYILVVFVSHLNGEIVYSIFEKSSVFITCLFTLLSFILSCVLYIIQWEIITIVWSRKLLRTDIKEKL